MSCRYARVQTTAICKTSSSPGDERGLHIQSLQTLGLQYYTAFFWRVYPRDQYPTNSGATAVHQGLPPGLGNGHRPLRDHPGLHQGRVDQFWQGETGGGGAGWPRTHLEMNKKYHRLHVSHEQLAPEYISCPNFDTRLARLRQGTKTCKGSSQTRGVQKRHGCSQ